ncbi:MAG: amidohydrolase [Lentisphaeria bacterium]|nr:amidohydrolase [Lentisphaeria bacterium]
METLVRKTVQKHLDKVIALRHELHKIPEIAGEEFKTADFLRQKLQELPGLEIRTPFLKTDLTALLGDQTKPNVTLRDDMDALPLTEKTNLPYRSTHEGMMHACGHDGHMAMVYGAALCLHELQHLLPCSVRFLFQPGEEVAAMAKPLMDAGALETPAPAFVAGLHSWPNVPHGVFSTRVGAVMASAGFFRITIRGKGGHGSLPHLANNPLETASEILLESKKIIPPGCVLTICALKGGSNTNVIPETAVLQGTLRYLNEDEGRKMVSDFEDLCRRVSEKNKVQCDFSCNIPYPPTIVKQKGFALTKAVTERFLGKEAFLEMEKSSMSSEDLSFYLQKYEGVFCHLGAGTQSAPLHSDTFDFDDTLLERGITFFTGLALSFKQ